MSFALEPAPFGGAALDRPGGAGVQAELAALPDSVVLDEGEIEEIRALGDNTGSMALKGASGEHEGPAAPDRWPLTAELEAAGRRFGIDAVRDLGRAGAAAS